MCRENCGLFEVHEYGELLGGIWWDIRQNILASTSTLDSYEVFVDWSFLTIGGETALCDGCGAAAFKQSAGPRILEEVLEADDNDGNLNNGTPHDDEICAAFASHGIEGSICAESRPRECRADCDGSTGPGILDVFDFLCFQRRVEQRDPWACDFDTSSGPGTCDVLDFLAFQDAFAGGCR
jgi:hypothetical protein